MRKTHQSFSGSSYVGSDESPPLKRRDRKQSAWTRRKIARPRWWQSPAPGPSRHAGCVEFYIRTLAFPRFRVALSAGSAKLPSRFWNFDTIDGVAGFSRFPRRVLNFKGKFVIYLELTMKLRVFFFFLARKIGPAPRAERYLRLKIPRRSHLYPLFFFVLLVTFS